jgi:hypothetical protein
MTVGVSTARHVSGTHSLAVAFSQSIDLGDGLYRIQVSLCGGAGIDLGNKRLQAQIFMDAQNSIQVAYGTTLGPEGPVTWNPDPFAGLPAGIWNSVTTAPFPPGTVSSETNIGFEVTVKFGSAGTPTAGTIYFDDISVL